MSKILQLLRNTTPYESYSAALTGLKAKLTATDENAIADGSPILARYTENGEEHTLLGIKSASGYEIFDNAGSNQDIKDAIDKLDSSVAATAASGNVYSVLTGVTQTNGVLSAKDEVTLAAVAKTGAAADVAIADSGSLIAAETVEGALAEIAAKIDGMDLDAVGGGNGDVITKVSEADGKVNASKSSLTDVKLTGYTKTSGAGAIAATDSLKQALSKLENKSAATTVKSTDKTVTITDNSGKDLAVNIDNKTLVKDSSTGAISANLTLTKLTDTEVTALKDSNVKEAYKVIYSTDANRTAIGDVVKVYKDSSLHNVYLGHVDDVVKSKTDPTVVPGTGSEALCFIYQKADGTYELVAVNVESFLQESEFSNGLEVDNTNHTVSVKIDSTSENFLTVGSGGVKLSGVQSAITTAINALDVTNDAAEAGKYVASIQEANGIVSVKTRANVSEAVLNSYAKGSEATAVAATDTINQAISKLENQIGNAGAASKTTLTEAAADAIVPATGAPKIVVTKSKESDGHYNYAVTAQDMASAKVLTAEIAARKAVDGQSGDTYAKNSKANYIANATSLNDADVKLDAALKTADNAMLTGVAAGNGINVTTKTSKSQSISAKAVSNDPIIEVTASGIGTKANAVWDCGTY
jgi:hypothetical protein